MSTFDVAGGNWFSALDRLSSGRGAVWLSTAVLG